MATAKKKAPKKEPKTPPVEVNPEELTPTQAKEIKVIERIIETKEIAPQDAFGQLTRPQIELIKGTIAKGASDDELRLFIQVCKGAQLNPFMKQVFLVPRWDARAGKETRAIQVSIDGFRAIAEGSGSYAGNEDAKFDGEKEIDTDKSKIKVPLTAFVIVYKIVQGVRYEFTATARWDEYYPGPKNGFQWHIRPYLMLGKCAEALALRKAFPKLLSGMYAQEALDQSAGENTEAQKVQQGFDLMMKVIKESTAKECNEFKAKIENSDKYTLAQKVQVAKEVDKRIKALKK